VKRRIGYGRDELLRRLAHPFWFQSFGAVMGMDWHSSGITTSVVGALKRGLAPLASELGIHVCGGRGTHSRRTPHELHDIGARVGFDGAELAAASRLVAKVDSAAVQDGFDLYLHGFIVTDDGHWAVVQQGMNGDRRQARRYHWLSEGLANFVDAPHAAIAGEPQGEIVNLADRRAEASRRGQLDLLASLGPDRIVREMRGLSAPSAAPPDQPLLPPHLVMPAHYDVHAGDVNLRRLHATLVGNMDMRDAERCQCIEDRVDDGRGPRTCPQRRRLAAARRPAWRYPEAGEHAGRPGILLAATLAVGPAAGFPIPQREASSTGSLGFDDSTRFLISFDRVFPTPLDRPPALFPGGNHARGTEFESVSLHLRGCCEPDLVVEGAGIR
jgi:hypothetical protein